MAVEELQKKTQPSSNSSNLKFIYSEKATKYMNFSVSSRRVCEKQFETECVMRVTLFWASNVRSHVCALFVSKWQEIAILLPYLTVKNS